MICPLSSVELTKCNLPLFAGNTNTLKLDDLVDGLKCFMKDNESIVEDQEHSGLHEVYKFFTRYVRRIHPDTHWKKAMKMNPNVIWFQLITPSDIAFVILLVKNGMPVWNKKKVLFDVEESRKTKAKPVFTSGEGQKGALDKRHGVRKG